MTELTRVVVCILTYRRPEMLLDAVRSVLPDIINENYTLLIVDNDPEASAEKFVNAVGSSHIQYIVEPIPGIAAARNAGLSFARSSGYTDLVFLDDDEYVDPGWLAILGRCRRDYSADVVCGPVVPRFVTERRSLLQRSGLFDRPAVQTGGEVRWPATNNCWIHLIGVVGECGIKFDHRFSLTGGEDSEFFRQVRLRSGRIVGCAEAVVYEQIPDDRLTLTWIWRRGVRLGNTSAQVTFADRSVKFIRSVALGRIGLALPIFVVASALSRRLHWPSLMHIPKGIGMIQASRGVVTLEYGRSTS